MRVCWHKNVVTLSVPVKVDKSRWNYDSQRCSRNSTHFGKSSTEINGEIERYAAKAAEIFNDCGDAITADEYREKLRVLFGRQERKTTAGNFFTLWAKFASERATLNNWTLGTIKNVESIRKRFYRFNPLLTIEQLDETTLTHFFNSLIRNGYNNETIKKTLSVFHWFVNWLKSKGIDTNGVTERFKPKIKVVKPKDRTVVFLRWEELIKLYEYPFSEQSLQQVRDVFCFCCFTSLRYSDAAKLTRSQVHEKFIDVLTVKTASALHIELNKYSRSILEKYATGKKPTDFALPAVSNQRSNILLKQIGKAVGIDEPVKRSYYIGSERHEETLPKYEFLTTHCGRRTFIVNALQMEIPPQVVMEWTGHADYDAMRPYIAIVNEQRADAMSLFDKR